MGSRKTLQVLSLASFLVVLLFGLWLAVRELRFSFEHQVWIHYSTLPADDMALEKLLKKQPGVSKARVTRFDESIRIAYVMDQDIFLSKPPTIRIEAILETMGYSEKVAPTTERVEFYSGD